MLVGGVFMKYYIVDAFTSEVFKGNPAAVCIIDKMSQWPDDIIMQNIAIENNLSETAFVIKNNDDYNLRWFTPENEIDLCGHATLAAAFVISNFVDNEKSIIKFNTVSGLLTVERNNDLYVMDFPSRKAEKVEIQPIYQEILGIRPIEAYKARDLMLVFQNEHQIKNAKPDFNMIKKLNDILGIIITAKGQNSDFVSRFFTTIDGVPEDPVTGSSHCNLIPYWSERLEKSQMTALQLSKRGGVLYCEDLGERVKISGNAVLYAMGEICADL